MLGITWLFSPGAQGLEEAHCAGAVVMLGTVIALGAVFGLAAMIALAVLIVMAGQLWLRSIEQSSGVWGRDRQITYV